MEAVEAATSVGLYLGIDGCVRRRGGGDGDNGGSGGGGASG